jgi:hypothetical protein
MTKSYIVVAVLQVLGWLRTSVCWKIEEVAEKPATYVEIKRIVATEEKLQGGKVRVPLVCQKYGIDAIGIIEMLRREE